MKKGHVNNDQNWNYVTSRWKEWGTPSGWQGASKRRAERRSDWQNNARAKKKEGVLWREQEEKKEGTGAAAAAAKVVAGVEWLSAVLLVKGKFPARGVSVVVSWAASKFEKSFYPPPYPSLFLQYKSCLRSSLRAVTLWNYFYSWTWAECCLFCLIFSFFLSCTRTSKRSKHTLSNKWKGTFFNFTQNLFSKKYFITPPNSINVKVTINLTASVQSKKLEKPVKVNRKKKTNNFSFTHG